MIRVNGDDTAFRQGLCIGELASSLKPGADLFIVNGFPVSPDTQLTVGDQCWLIRRGEVPSPAEFKKLLYARHTPGVQERISRAVVGIMGLGGLGSAVAVALARMGVGALVLADFDIVDPTNLNRQQYFVDQIGTLKTEALKDNLARINPFVDVRLVSEKLTEESIPDRFAETDVLVECFDDAAMKAAGLRAALTSMRDCRYVGSSGVAGFGPNNRIRTVRLYRGVYVVGDLESAAAPGQGLMAARVGIAAHHQANQTIRLLLGEEDDSSDEYTL